MILHEWLVFLWRVFEYPPKWFIYSTDMADATWICCHFSAFCVHHTTMHHVTSCKATSWLPGDEDQGHDYLVTGMRKEKDRSWFQKGSMGLMGSVPDSRFRYSLFASSLKLLPDAPMMMALWLSSTHRRGVCFCRKLVSVSVRVNHVHGVVSSTDWWSKYAAQ